jgi:uncharacterized protein YecE (DUF72 family)
MSTIRIGVSGFRYAHWRGAFYPEGLPQRHELAYAASKVGSIEINGSFYSLQRPSFYRQWCAAVPPGYVFAVKGGRFITHMKKLRDVEGALANFLGSGVLCLGKQLGPILWQFPENMPCDLERFDAFFAMLPRTIEAAAGFALEHHTRTLDDDAVEDLAAGALRYAVEIRNPQCLTAAFMVLLRKHRIAWVIADTAGRFPYSEEVTADFVYVRLHGDTKLYASGYGPRAIARWAERIAQWSTGKEPADAVHVEPAARRRTRDVYVYFDNDGSAHAPHDAVALQSALAHKPELTRKLVLPKPQLAAISGKARRRRP